MDRAEDQALRSAQEKFYTSEVVTAETQFTAQLISTMHRAWLRDIYSWAGEYRSVDMAKGAFVFPPAVRVAENMSCFERQVLAIHTPCRPTELRVVCQSLAVVHAELLLIHPFREGNGRIARWLADMMCAQAGLPLPAYAFSGTGSGTNRARYLAAVIAGYGEDYEDLADFFETAVRRRLDAER